MSYDAKRHVIHTRADGLLDGTTPAELAAIARAAAAAERVVLHFHGGLVSSKRGFAAAERLTPEYQQVGAYPVFFVWSSGLVEQLTGNLREILVEDLGQRLLRWLLRFTVGKIGQSDGQRTAGVLTLPYEMEVNAELRGRSTGREPYDGLPVPRSLPRVVSEEAAELEQAVSTDDGLAELVESVLAERHPERVVPGARGVPVRRQVSSRTLMSPEVLDAIDPGPGQRGLVSTALLAKKLAGAFAAVVERFRAGTDHGVYPTVVEELLREFYLANVGAAVWAAMKKDTLDTFVADGKERGGTLFLDEFGRAASAAARRPEVSAVGHSTGAVFIDNLLATERLRLRNVVLLAPACTFDHLAGALRHRHLVDRFRVFTLDDGTERADQLVPGLYPRSLLYLVSGLLERDPTGASAVVPVAGLQRYYLDQRFGELESVRVVRDFVLQEDRVVWSPSVGDALAGLRCRSATHSGFDEDSDALDSIRVLLGDS